MALVPAVCPLHITHSITWWYKASLCCELLAAQPVASASRRIASHHLLGIRLGECCSMGGCKTQGVVLLWWWAAAHSCENL